MSETPGDKAERLTQIALELASVVRDEDRDGITRHLAEIQQVDKDALIVCLAALVDIDQSARDLLAWVTWNEDGDPLHTVHVKPAVRAGHNAFMRGERTDDVMAAERAYQRQRGRQRRRRKSTQEKESAA